jgi:hypothetical protein
MVKYKLKVNDVNNLRTEGVYQNMLLAPDWGYV